MSEVKPGWRSRPLLRTMVGNVLRRHRLDQGRTLADVAREARVSVPYLSEVERGRKEASSEVLAAICDALRVELAAVLTEVGHDLAAVRAPVRPLDAARLDAARHNATRLDAARLDATRLDATRLDATRLDAVRTGAVRLGAVRARRAVVPPARPMPYRSGDVRLRAG